MNNSKAQGQSLPLQEQTEPQSQSRYMDHLSKNVSKEAWLEIVQADKLYDHNYLAPSKAQVQPEVVKDLYTACKCVVDGYEDDGMEQMGVRDEVFYDCCKLAIDKYLSAGEGLRVSAIKWWDGLSCKQTSELLKKYTKATDGIINIFKAEFPSAQVQQTPIAEQMEEAAAEAFPIVLKELFDDTNMMYEEHLEQQYLNRENFIKGAKWSFVAFKAQEKKVQQTGEGSEQIGSVNVRLSKRASDLFKDPIKAKEIINKLSSPQEHKEQGGLPIAEQMEEAAAEAFPIVLKELFDDTNMMYEEHTEQQYLNRENFIKGAKWSFVVFKTQEQAPQVGMRWVKADTIIPPMVHELGKYWDQPSLDNILLTDKEAKMSKEDFDKLPTYSMSNPSGAYEGKMWKGEFNKEWYLCWWGVSNKPESVSGNKRKIICEWLSESPVPVPDLKFISMNIVNQLFDIAEVPVKKRQEINDTCDEFVFKLLKKSHSVPVGDEEKKTK